MTIERRVAQLEKALRESQGDYALFHMSGNEVDAEIIRMPKPDQDGLAILNGEELPVKLSVNDIVFIENNGGFEPNVLTYAKRDGDVIKVILPEGISEDDI